MLAQFESDRGTGASIFTVEAQQVLIRMDETILSPLLALRYFLWEKL
ncbi:MAG: hypothetical protein F6K14_18160 [Symploca sp. SIO2C1]|nr:hypothetical protein [Symploca sp. SIO2C1]